MAAAPALPDHQPADQPQAPQIAQAPPAIPHDLRPLSTAAAQLGIATRTIRKWMSKGVVGYYELVNGQLRVSLSELVQRRVKPGDKRFVKFTDAGQRLYLHGSPARKPRKR